MIVMETTVNKRRQLRCRYVKPRKQLKFIYFVAIQNINLFLRVILWKVYQLNETRITFSTNRKEKGKTILVMAKEKHYAI